MSIFQKKKNIKRAETSVVKDKGKPVEAKRPTLQSLDKDKKRPVQAGRFGSEHRKGKGEHKSDIKPEEPRKIIVKPMVLSDFAQEAGKRATDVILTLLKWGVICAKNQVLSEDVVERLAKHYEVENRGV